MFVLTQHGGHMGFFEGAVLLPHPLTWMDKVVVECVDALCWWEEEQPWCENQQNERPSQRSETKTSDSSLMLDLRTTDSNFQRFST